MSNQDKLCWPAAKIQRKLRAGEALMELVRAQRVLLASQVVDQVADSLDGKPKRQRLKSNQRAEAL
jgi:hypothetical protein